MLSRMALLASTSPMFYLGSDFFGPIKSKEPRPNGGLLEGVENVYLRNQSVLTLCGDCEFLSPSEKTQKSPKQKHMCAKYNKQVFHFNCHPKIFKCEECIEGASNATDS